MMQSTKPQLCQRLTYLVTRSGLSIRQISDSTGIPKSALHRYMTGATRRVPYDRLKILADFFHASLNELSGEPGRDDGLDEVREALRRRPGMRTLFSVARDCTPDELQQAALIIAAMKEAAHD